jgi:hypothetical protein
MPLEGLYFSDVARDSAIPTFDSWRLMILLPDEVDGELVDIARVKAIEKKGLPRLGDVRVQTFSEGACVQLLHIGPYADEPATVGRLFEFARERGFRITGAHHEIYLNDPARTATDKLRTIIRYGVGRTG